MNIESHSLKTLLLASIATIAPGTGIAQSLIDSNSFFDPDFQIRQTGASSGVLSLTVDNSTVSGPGTEGNVAWNHSAGGFAQARSQIVIGIPLANLDVQLAAYTETLGNSLVFGREFTADAQLLGVVDAGPSLQGLVNQVAGASVLYDWQSTAAVSGLAIVPDQLYQVDFAVTSGSGLPVNLLDSAMFGITSAGISKASDDSAALLNLLDTIVIGEDPATGNFSFVFKSNQPHSELRFRFAASTAVGVSLFSGTAENQNVLTFSGFQVTAIPEPDSFALCGSFAALITLRRRRNS